VPPQDAISRDNVSVKVNAVIYFRVVDAERAIIQVNNYLAATSQLAQTTLRWVLGKHDLDTMLAERDKLNADIQDVLDKQTEAWGIKVSNVEIKRTAFAVARPARGGYFVATTLDRSLYRCLDAAGPQLLALVTCRAPSRGNNRLRRVVHLGNRRGTDHEPADPLCQPLSAPARPQPSGLVPMGRGGD
jgi:hypothetical protein